MIYSCLSWRFSCYFSSLFSCSLPLSLVSNPSCWFLTLTQFSVVSLFDSHTTLSCTFLPPRHSHHTLKYFKTHISLFSSSPWLLPLISLLGVYTYNLNILCFVTLCVFSYICIYLSFLRVFFTTSYYTRVFECVQGEFLWMPLALLFSMHVPHVCIWEHAHVCKCISIHLPGNTCAYSYVYVSASLSCCLSLSFSFPSCSHFLSISS